MKLNELCEDLVFDLKEKIGYLGKVYWKHKFYPDFSGMSCGTDEYMIFQKTGLFEKRKLASFIDDGTFPSF